VIAVRSAADHKPIGCIVNYTCHPTHHGGDDTFSGGYPAALCKALEGKGWPAALFLNGACADIHDADPANEGRGMPAEEIGRVLCEDVQAFTTNIAYSGEAQIGCATTSVDLDFRALTDDEIRGKVRGAQRFYPDDVYDPLVQETVAKIRREKTQRAELQALFIGDHVLAAVPAEYFVAFGLEIKEKTWPRRTLVVSCANGMVGYLPTLEAFRRGGYETTFYNGTCLAHGAGEQVAAEMVRLINDNLPR
jgi:hypothetical protein